MDSDLDDQPRSVPEKTASGKRAYIKPVLLCLGTLNDVTRSVGTRAPRTTCRRAISREQAFEGSP